jgi:hypothetical protein
VKESERVNVEESEAAIKRKGIIENGEVKKNA